MHRAAFSNATQLHTSRGLGAPRMLKFMTTLPAILVSSIVAAQSASVLVTAPVTSASPGDVVTITVEAQFDAAGMPSGIFGSAGLFGFGGDVVAAGTISATSDAGVPMINPLLGFGLVAQQRPAADRFALGAGGRGFDGGLSGPVQTLMSFDVTIDASATAGDTIEMGFAGSVVLVLGDELRTFSTDPGVNQSSLAVTPVSLTVAGGRLCADQNEDGFVTPADFNVWVLNFNAQNSLADVNQDGLVNPADFNAWVLAFNAGAAGPTCAK